MDEKRTALLVQYMRVTLVMTEAIDLLDLARAEGNGLFFTIECKEIMVKLRDNTLEVVYTDIYGTSVSLTHVGDKITIVWDSTKDLTPKG